MDKTDNFQGGQFENWIPEETVIENGDHRHLHQPSASAPNDANGVDGKEFDLFESCPDSPLAIDGDAMTLENWEVSLSLQNQGRSVSHMTQNMAENENKVSVVIGSDHLKKEWVSLLILCIIYKSKHGYHGNITL